LYPGAAPRTSRALKDLPKRNVVSPLPAGIATGVWIHRREGLKGKHRWNGLLIPAATAMVLLGMCDSATTDTFGVQIAAGVADHHVHKLENASIKEPNPGINFSQLYLQYNFWAALQAG
jgi:hypothetical protein